MPLMRAQQLHKLVAVCCWLSLCTNFRAAARRHSKKRPTGQNVAAGLASRPPGSVGDGLNVPRVTAAELRARPELLAGTSPYILTGEASAWPALHKWADLDFLAAPDRIKHETVDYCASMLVYAPQNQTQLMTTLMETTLMARF